jgi:hypothetical protein
MNIMVSRILEVRPPGCSSSVLPPPRRSRAAGGIEAWIDAVWTEPLKDRPERFEIAATALRKQEASGGGLAASAPWQESNVRTRFRKPA